MRSRLTYGKIGGPWLAATVPLETPTHLYSLRGYLLDGWLARRVSFPSVFFFPLKEVGKVSISEGIIFDISKYGGSL